MKKNLLTTIDLFAGIGGIRKGFEDAGFSTLFANDFDGYCKYTYDLNFDKPYLFIEDLRKLKDSDLPDKFGALLGGFPCQPFSIAGYRKGFDDKNRGNLFWDIVNILKKKKPSLVFLENVKNLYSHDSGNTYKVIEESLNSLGYKIKTKILNTMEYGNVPQNRERVYIVGFLSQKAFEVFEFPDKIKLTKKITDILEKKVPEKYYYDGKPLYKKLCGTVKSPDTVYQWRRTYVRENKKG